jgi:hypothetical protein
MILRAMSIAEIDRSLSHRRFDQQTAISRRRADDLPTRSDGGGIGLEEELGGSLELTLRSSTGGSPG